MRRAINKDRIVVEKMTKFMDLITSIEIRNYNRGNVKFLKNESEVFKLNKLIPSIEKSTVFSQELKDKLLEFINYYLDNIDDNIENYDDEKSIAFLEKLNDYSTLDLSKVVVE